MIKQTIRKFIPEPILSAYHLLLAKLAALAYGNPSAHLVVIGVTGTNGKSSTVMFLGRMLESMGETVGWTSTAGFKVGAEEWENHQKMTMLGRFQTQKILKKMVRSGCRYAIVETSSQGIDQFRHIGINYDQAIFTNLTPEHIEAHGGFENYKAAKGKLFAHLSRRPRKTIAGKRVNKTIVANADDPNAPYFLSFPCDQSTTFGIERQSTLQAEDVAITAEGTDFKIQETMFHIAPLGRFNLYNVLGAIAGLHTLRVPLPALAEAAGKLHPVPGRFESISEGQPFTVIVDYAYEPAALQAVYDTIELLTPKRIIHVTGSAGGGRDVARREVIGKLAAEHDDIVIVANEDPYDEDPMQIINDVADAALLHGKTDGTDLFRILDRQAAIEKAVSFARPGDLVLITGKGSEPVMAVENGKKIPWDDRVAVREALAQL